MNSLIFYSKENVAGRNIANELISLNEFESQGEIERNGRRFNSWKKDHLTIIELRDSHLHCEYLSDCFPPEKFDLFIFVSTHKSETNTPALTCHSTGNFTSFNALGGNPFELCRTSAIPLKKAFLSLKENKLEGYDVTLEATHHGPTTLQNPSLFVEVGSTEKEWNDIDACKAAAKAILSACSEEKVNGKIALGFGGTHYCSKFNELEGKEYAFSFICAKCSVA